MSLSLSISTLSLSLPASHTLCSGGDPGTGPGVGSGQDPVAGPERQRLFPLSPLQECGQSHCQGGYVPSFSLSTPLKHTSRPDAA